MGVYKRFILVLLLFFPIYSNPGAIESPHTSETLFSPENIRITNDYSSEEPYSDINRTIKSFMRIWSIKGASIAIAKDGQLIYAKGFGVTDTITKEPVQPYHKFRIASISKLITAIAIMKLREEGKLSIDDKVFGPNGILNDSFFAYPKDSRVYDITIAHLLSHEGGWTQRYGDQMFMPITVSQEMGVKPPADTKTIVRFALDKRLHFSPGQGRSYSNLGYSILGLVIEKVSGMSYETYCKKNVLEPSGIYDMTLARNLYNQKSLYEVSYYTPPDIILKPSIYDVNKMVVPCYGGNDIEALGGAGAWIATAPDLIKLLLSVDGFDTRSDLLSRESIDFMTDSRHGGYAPVGWKATTVNGIWWRTGSFPGSAGMIKRMPDGTAWVLLSNSSCWNGPEIHSFINIMMTRVMAKARQWPQRDLLPCYVPVPLAITSGDSVHIHTPAHFENK